MRMRHQIIMFGYIQWWVGKSQQELQQESQQETQTIGRHENTDYDHLKCAGRVT